MEEAIALQAIPRTVIGKQVNALRRQGFVPGIIYGHNIDPIPVQFNAHDLARYVTKFGTSSTVQVTLEGVSEPYLAIFRDIQYHRLRRAIRHLDLQALSLTEKVRMPLPITLVGESSVVALGALLLQQLNELEVEALPGALVPTIEIDISVLTEMGQSILVGDVVPPEGIEILNAPGDIIVQVTHVEEEKEAGTAPESVEVEVITKRPEKQED
ncbi:MAG TPA: 50S ribosomal protein L25 [Anaerolineae bacterium]|nr:50S ribosomal protein L25 [Anaerolineae bacterium]